MELDCMQVFQSVCKLVTQFASLPVGRQICYCCSIHCTMDQNRIKKTEKIAIIHCPTSSGVSKVSKRASEWAQRSAWAKQVVRTKRICERCKWTSERRSEWPSTPIFILGYSGPQCIVSTRRTANGLVHLLECDFPSLIFRWMCDENNVIETK